MKKIFLSAAGIVLIATASQAQQQQKTNKRQVPQRVTTEQPAPIERPGQVTPVNDPTRPDNTLINQPTQGSPVSPVNNDLNNRNTMQQPGMPNQPQQPTTSPSTPVATPVQTPQNAADKR